MHEVVEDGRRSCLYRQRRCANVGSLGIFARVQAPSDWVRDSWSRAPIPSPFVEGLA